MKAKLRNLAYNLVPLPWFRVARLAWRDARSLPRRLRGQAKGEPFHLLHGVGEGDRLAASAEFFGYFKDLGRLAPDHAILDIGCGTGRMTLHLTDFICPPGDYVGFDVSERAIRYCSQTITRKHPHFRFVHADIENAEYNARAGAEAGGYRFPCEEASRDFVFATSVFTHLREDVTQHYLNETARSLKPGGRALLTFFVLNEDSRVRMKETGSHFDFASPLSPATSVADPRSPERAIAYDEAALRAMFASAGLTIVEPVRYGAWSGRSDGLSFQDIVIAEKAGD